MLIFVYALCGLGLFFFGLNLITVYLKNSTTHTIREKTANLAKNPLLGLITGGVSRLLTQSSSAAIFMLICALKAGLIKLKDSFFIVIGIDAVGAASVYLIAFDIKYAIFIILGISCFTFTSDMFYKYRNISGVFIGVGLLFLGLYTIQEGVAGVRSAQWFLSAFHLVNKSYILALIVGMIACYITQSSLAVIAIVMILYKSSVIPLSTAIMITYGAFIGSSLLTLTLSLKITGESKQISMFQVLYNFVGCLLFVPAMYLETYVNIPLIAALLTILSDNKGFQLAALMVVFNIGTAPLMALLIPVLSKIFTKLFPESPEEEISKPKYLNSCGDIDAGDAMKLVELEQFRLLEANMHLFTMLRNNKQKPQVNKFIEAISDLTKIITEYLSILPNKHSMKPGMYKSLGILFDIQNSLGMLNDAMHFLVNKLYSDTFYSSPEKKSYFDAVVEGLDVILMIVSEISKNHESHDPDIIFNLTAESKKGIERMRTAYLKSSDKESPQNKMELLSVTSDCEKIILVLQKLTEKIYTLRKC